MTNTIIIIIITIPNTIESNVITKRNNLIQNYSEGPVNINKHNIYISDKKYVSYETNK